MNAKIYPPSEALKDFVMCYWTLEAEREIVPKINTIVPDGTMKLIFHYADTYYHYLNDGERILLPRCFLIGQLTKPYLVEPVGVTGSFVVRFHPYGFLPFATTTIRDMENTAIPLDVLFGQAGNDFGLSILNASTTQERIAIIEPFLLARLTSQQAIDTIVNATVETILNAKGNISIKTHSSTNNIDRRQLTRKFTKTIGLSPKQLAKTMRIQAVLKVLLTQKVDRLTDLAYDNAYFDQAHFIKEFKEFTGLTPKEFYGDELKMSLIFEGKSEQQS